MSNLDKLKQVIADCLQISVNRVTPSLSQDDIADWDSMAMVNLISEIETVFNVSFDINDMLSFKSVGLIIELLKEKGIEL